MLRCYRTDLHIHTCLSPCADLTMSPLRVVKMAKKKNLDIIGICDHNSAENVQYAINAGRLSNTGKNGRPSEDRRYEGREIEKTIKVLPGMEICTKEEVHIVALFDEIGDALKMQEIVYHSLPAEKNNPELFGEQIIANEFDEVEGYNDRLLIGATGLSLYEVTECIHRLNGLAIAAHIDREAFSLTGQLGFIPEDLKIDAIEISRNISVEQARQKFPGINQYPVIQTSDAHYLNEIGIVTTSFFIEKPTILEIKRAFHNEHGRKVLYE